MAPVVAVEQNPELRRAATHPVGGGIARRVGRGDDAAERQEHDRQMRLDQRVARRRAAGEFARHGGDAARNRLARRFVAAERHDARPGQRRPQDRALLQQALGAVDQQGDDAALDVRREAKAMHGARRNRHGDRRDERRGAAFQHGRAAAAQYVQNLKEVEVAVRSNFPIEARASRRDRFAVQPVPKESILAFAIEGVSRNRLHRTSSRLRRRLAAQVRIVQ